jgi:arylsulfatase A-like enzyme
MTASRLLLVLVLMLAGTDRTLSAESKTSSAPPNILFIFSDDHAFQAISAYADSRHLLETPNIDRIAREGMRFDRCLVTNSICGPSRATILTGKYSHLNGFPNNSNSRFDGTQPTFPKQLQMAGYSTALIGKWHLESDPTGFDFWQILPGQGIYYNPPMVRNGEKITEPGYVTDIITKRSIEWLEQRDKNKPFMLMTQHKAPHREWAPALQHLNHDNDRVYPEPETLFDDYANRGLAVRDQDMSIEKTFTDRDAKLVSPPSLTPEQKAVWDAYYEPRNEAYRQANPQGKDLVRWRYQRYMHDYLGTIKAVDESIGKLLKYLDDHGLADNTIVIYASDQGFFLGEHGWFDKRWVLEESLRTPLLVRWPGQIKPGSVNTDLVSNVDFAQTLIEMARAEPLPDTQGASLVPVLKGQTPTDWRKSFYYHYYEYPFPHRVRPHYGVITDQHKLVHFYAPDVDYWELYDRNKDPNELRSFYDDKEYAVIQKQLHQELARLRKELKVPDPDPPGFQGGRKGKKGNAGVRKDLDGTVLKFNFKDRSFKDQSAFNNHAKLQGNSLFHEDDGRHAFHFDGRTHLQISNSESLDPSGIPLTITVTLKADKPSGIILARGGEALGYCLYVNAQGQPVFAVNTGGTPVSVVGETSVLNRWTELVAVITQRQRVQLYADGDLLAEAPAAFIARDPSDSMQIGQDTGSAVIDPSLAQGFIGSIQQVEIHNGEKLPSATADSSLVAPPNVVLIFCDDMGYGDLASYGSKTNRTPHLDQLAREGVRFTRFYVPQPVCSASRAALMTGCYPSRVGVQGALGPGARTGLNLNEVTLAEIVKQRGYATAAIGKWHLGDHPSLLPVHQGFDGYFGLPYSNDMWPHHPDNGRRKNPFPALPLIEDSSVIDADVTAEDQTQLTTRYTQRAVEFIRHNQAKQTPFFLYLAHSMPHVPLYVSKKNDQKSPYGLYADVIEEIDWSAGEVLRALKESGLEDNTLVIFTSDNGPRLNYGTHAGSALPLREGKGTVWEGGVRVPFIARWPGKIPAGRVVEEPAMTIDLLPTIASLLGARLPDHRIDGLDILPLLTAQPGAKNPHPAYYFYYKQNELQAVMSGDWKVYLPHAYRSFEGPGRSDGRPVRYGQKQLEAPELYNVVTDISETTNVAARHPDVLARLLMLAESAREDLGDNLQQRFGVGVREAARLELDVR